MSQILKIAAVFIGILGLAFWWLLLDARAPKTGSADFDIEAFRTLTADHGGALPLTLNMEIVGSGNMPGFAAQAGNFRTGGTVVYTAFQIAYADKTILIGGAVDQETVDFMAETAGGDAMFDQAAYDRMTSAMLAAEQVWFTHEHLDHVMGIARHPSPVLLAPRLKINAAQLAALPQFAKGSLAPEIAAVSPTDTRTAQAIAPGLVVAPTPGHTKGSLTFFMTLATGEEYLLIGDIVWVMSNIDTLKTRPRLLQYVAFDPKEDRNAVLAQVRALHDLQTAEPDLNIVPSHDAEHLEGLMEDGKIVKGFVGGF